MPLLNRSDFLECMMMSMLRPDILVNCLAKLIEFVSSFSVMEGEKFSMSKTTSVLILVLNVGVPVDYKSGVFSFFCLTVVLMFSRIYLLMRPISLLAGLISLHVGLFWKMSLWSCNSTNAFRSAIRTFSFVIDVKISGNVLCFVVNGMNSICIGFLVGRCYIVS